MDLNKIGTFLKKLRKEKGYTQQEVADELYVSSKSVSRWENGDGIPDIDTLVELAKFYSVSVDELLRGEKTETTKIISNKNTSKKLREKLISKMNGYLTVSLSISSGMFVAGIILSLLFDFSFLLIMLTIGIIASIIIYLFGLNESKRKAKDDEEILEEDVIYLEHSIKNKTKLFKHITISLTSVLLSLLFLASGEANIAFFGIGSLLIIYFITHVSYKKELTCKMIQKRVLISLPIITILFTIMGFTVTYSCLYGGKHQTDALLIDYLINCFSYGYLSLKLMGMILFWLTIVLSILINFIKIKYKIFIIIGLFITGLLSNILPIIDLINYPSVLVETSKPTFTIPGMYILANFLSYLLIYFINYQRGKKNAGIEN